MFGLIKIAGLSAVLSAGLVTAFDGPSGPERAPVASQKFSDRMPQDGAFAVRQAAVETAASATLAGEMKTGAGKGDLHRATADCAAQTWPNIPHGCLTSADGRPMRQAARMITVEERREGERTSVLARLPATELARR